jgi:hypothetical protein
MKAKPKRQPGVIAVEQVVAALKKMLVAKSGLKWTVTARRETSSSVPWIVVTSPKNRQVQGKMSLEDRVELRKMLGRPGIPPTGISFIGTQEILSNLLAMCRQSDPV